MTAQKPFGRFLPILVTAVGLPFSAAFAGALEVRGTVELPGGRGRCMLSLVALESDSRGLGVEPAVSATSGEEGRFRLEAPAPGMWKLVAETPGFPPMVYEPLPLVQAVELAPLVLKRPGLGTTLRVEGPSGKPLPGAGVCAERTAKAGPETVADRGWNVAPQCGRTDEQGRFVFLGTPEQRFDLRVRAPGRSEKTGSVAAGREVTLRLGAAVAEGPATRAADGGAPPATAPRGTRVSGRVLDAVTGKPIVEALVWSGEDHGLFTRTDTWGRYGLVVHGSGGFWIQAHAAGYFPQAALVPQERARRGQAPALALRPATDVTGKVVDSDGNPLEGVRLAAFCLETRFLFRTDPADSRSTSGAGGKFRLARLDAAGRTYELQATRDGYVSAAVPLTGLRPGRVESRGTLTLLRSRSAHGKVLDADERPIQGAVVSLRPTGSRPVPGHGTPRPPEGGDEERHSATSDETGRFQVAELPASRIDVTVVREGYVPVTVRGVEVPPGGKPADLGTVVLEPGAVVEGVVVDVDGTGLAGAEILVAEQLTELRRLTLTDPKLVEPDVVSDAEGRFAVPDLLRGRQVHLLVRRKGYSPSSTTGIAPPTREPLTVVLQSAARVSGRALDEEERPIAGALFELRFPTPPTDTGSLTGILGESALMASSDEQGLFAFDGVTPGEAKLQAFADGFQLPPLRDIRVPKDDDVEGLTIVFEKGAVVRGRVLTAEEEPVAGARVHVGGPGVTSDAEGVYLLAGVGPGPRTLEAYDQQHGSAVREIEVEPGENTFDLVFTPGFEVRGRVVDETGAGLAEVHVRLHSRRGGRAGLRYEAFTDEHGVFTLSAVLAGTYGVEATLEGFAPAILAQGLTVAAEPVEDFEVVLSRGATLTGTVGGLDFYELAEVRVRVDRDDGWSKSVRPSYEGTYEMRHLPPGDYRVIASLREGTREARSWVTLYPGDEEVRDLELGDALRLTGQVLLGPEPLGGVRVLLTGLDVAANRSVLTDHEGFFHVEDLIRGRYRLQASDPRRGLLNSLDLEIHSDRDLLVEFALAELSGQVVDATDSGPVSGALIVLRHLDSPDPAREGYMRAVGSDTEGFFSMPRVTAGRYRLTARKEGYTSAEQVLDLRGGDRLESLRIELVPSRGLDLEVRLASGGRPPHVTLSVLEPSGRTVFFASRPVGPEGIASFSSVPSGSWELMVGAPGGAWVSTTADVPGPPRSLVLPRASRLKVRVPKLSTEASMATLTLTGSDGEPFRGLSPSGEVRQRWPLEGGRAIVDSLPAGLWTMNVTAQDGQSWSGTVAAAGPETEVTLE